MTDHIKNNLINSIPLQDDVRSKYINDLQKEKDGWHGIIIIAVLIILIVIGNMIGLPGGWWILLWVFIGSFISGAILFFVEGMTNTKEKLLNCSDELLILLFSIC